MAKKKLTINQQQWKKEMERIERFQKSASKRGFYFPDDLLPQQPKRITKKALEHLANLTPEEQYKKAVYLDKKTGDMLKGSEGRKIERSRASKKGWQTRKYKATPRPTPDEPIIDSPDEPILNGGEPENGITGEPEKGIGGGGRPLDVNSLIRAMDRALERPILNEFWAMTRDFEIKLLRATWNSTKERFKDHKYVLEAYLSDHDVELQNCLDTIKYDSDEWKVSQAINRLLELLNYNEPLSTETLKEFESEYTNIDLTDIDLPTIDE